MFDRAVIVPLDAGEKASHRYEFPLAGNWAVFLETWCVGNHAADWKAFRIPRCQDILLCNDLEDLNEGWLTEGKVLRRSEKIERKLATPATQE
jgi:hypothetical protein